MEKLRIAETYDHFFETVQSDPVNRRARQHLSYVAMSNTTQPWIVNTEIVTMHPTAEAGLPHTRPPNIICIPAYYPDEHLPKTLAHEFIHIDQRRRLYKWNSYFEKGSFFFYDRDGNFLSHAKSFVGSNNVFSIMNVNDVFIEHIKKYI
jgi:hypothetical protein